MFGLLSSKRVAPNNQHNSGRISSARVASLRRKDALKHGIFLTPNRRRGYGDDSNWLDTEVHNQSSGPASAASTSADDQILSPIHAKKYQAFLKKYCNGTLLFAIVFVYGVIIQLSIIIHFVTKATLNEFRVYGDTGPPGFAISREWLTIVSSAATFLFFILPGYFVWVLRIWKQRLSSMSEKRFPPRIYTSLVPYMSQIEMMFCFGAVISQGLMLFARVYGGSCSTIVDRLNPIFCSAEMSANYLPQDSAIAVVFLPGVLYHAAKGALSWRLIMYHWFLSFLIILGCLVYSGSWSSWTLLLISCFEGVRLFAIHRQNLKLFRSVRDHNKKMLAALTDESKKVQTEEVRNIIANTAHDIKSPMQAFTNSMNLLKECINEVIEFARAHKEKSALRRIDEGVVGGSNDVEQSVISRRSNGSGGIGIGTGTGTGSPPAGFLIDDALLLEKYLLPCLDIVDDMYVTTEFMSMSLNRALDFSKVSHGIALVPSFQCANILDSIDWAIRCIQGLSENMTILMKPLPPDIFAYCITDRQWLNENLLCIMSNAVKFSSEGVVEIGVSLHDEEVEEVSSAEVRGSSILIAPTARTGRTQRVAASSAAVTPQGTSASKAGRIRMLKFTITDCGVGITEEAAEAAFKPMDNHVRQSTDRHSGGAGLGLYSLAKRVEVLGGKCGISKRTDGQQGTVCWFMEPYRPGDCSARAPPSEHDELEDERAAIQNTLQQAKNALESPRSARGFSSGGSEGSSPPRPNAARSSGAAAVVSRRDSRDSKEKSFTSHRRSRIASGGVFLPKSVRVCAGDSGHSHSVDVRGQNSLYGDMIDPLPPDFTAIRPASTVSSSMTMLGTRATQKASKDRLGIIGVLRRKLTGIKEAKAGADVISEQATIPTPQGKLATLKGGVASGRALVGQAGGGGGVPVKQAGGGLLRSRNNSSAAGSPGPAVRKRDSPSDSPGVVKAQTTATTNVLGAFSSAVTKSVRIVSSSTPMRMIKKRDSGTVVLAVPMQPLTVLVVDDSLPILKTITRTLEKAKHTVDTAQNGAVALEILKKKKFDVVLMDIQMPVMDGIETVEKLRQFEISRELEGVDILGETHQTAEVSDERRSSSVATNRGRGSHQIVIGVSANSDSDTASKALAAGMNKFMPKPFTISQFTEIVLQEAPEFVLHPSQSAAATPKFGDVVATAAATACSAATQGAGTCTVVA